jgi:hypothetical protein
MSDEDLEVGEPELEDVVDEVVHEGKGGEDHQEAQLPLFQEHLGIIHFKLEESCKDTE